MTTINKLTQSTTPSIKSKFSKLTKKLGLKSSHRKEDLPADVVEIKTKNTKTMSPTVKLYKLNSCLERIQNQISEVQETIKNVGEHAHIKNLLQKKLENLKTFANKVMEERFNTMNAK